MVNRRQFLGTGMLTGLSLLTGAGCTSYGREYKPLITEFNGLPLSPVMRWTDIMLQAVRNHNVHTLPASRSFAMAHLAGYMAVTGRSLGVLPVVDVPDDLNLDVTYAEAFCTALEEALSFSLVFQKRQFIAEYSTAPNLDASIAWGKKVGQQVVRLRTRDGAQFARQRFYPKQYTKQSGATSWQPTGPFYGAKNGPGFRSFARAEHPAWGAQKPWSINSASEYEAKTFLAPDSSEFKQQFEEVKTYGGVDSERRTADQTEVALFWENGLMGITVSGHFQLIAMQLVAQRPMDLIEHARLFALLSLAQADAGIVAWHNKYLFDVIRPETAIRFAPTRFADLNLPSDSRWQSYIPTPPFPSYVSGHSAFGAASVGILQHYFGGDRIRLTSPAPDMVNWPRQLQGVQRHYNSLRQLADENGMSRIYGGVHWQVDNSEGLRLGYAVADQVYNKARGA